MNATAHTSKTWGGRLLLQRVSTSMFAALTFCRTSYGDHTAGFACPHTHVHKHIVINEALVSGSRTFIVPLPIESVALLEEAALSLLRRHFFTKDEYEHFLANERRMSLRHQLSPFESGMKLGSGHSILMSPVHINVIPPD